MDPDITTALSMGSVRRWRAATRSAHRTTLNTVPSLSVVPTVRARFQTDHRCQVGLRRTDAGRRRASPAGPPQHHPPPAAASTSHTSSRIGTASPVCVEFAALLVAAGPKPRAGLGECHHASCVIPLPPVAAVRGSGRGRGGGGSGAPEAGSIRPGQASRAAPPPRWSISRSAAISRPRAMVTVRGHRRDQSPARRPGLLSQLLSRSLAVCTDHAACMTPAHPVGHEAREGAQRDRAQ
jgi:hypothetical protein